MKVGDTVKLKVGDTVKLKGTQGPSMVINSITDYWQADVVWFDCSESLRWAQFDLDALVVKED